MRLRTGRVLAVLAALFTLPVLEAMLLLSVGRRLGAWVTGLLLIAGAVFGIWLLRRAGHKIIFADGFFLAVAALLFLFPGFISDGLAAVLLVPAFRRFLRHRLIRFAFTSLRKR